MLPSSNPAYTAPAGKELLFLTDEQLRQSVEMIFFAYRAFTSDPDNLLLEHALGRAHHRALHFIGTRQPISVSALMDVLDITKQSLNRVLRELIEQEFVIQQVCPKDRRVRLLLLTEKGRKLEQELTKIQRERLRQAFLEAGPEAVAGFRHVLALMPDPEEREPLQQFVAGKEAL